jgi:hypothetical protein
MCAAGDEIGREKEVGGGIKEKGKRDFWRRLREHFRKRT